MNTFTVVITGYVVLLATWSSAIEALPSKESKVAADNDRQESTLAAPASLRRFTRGQVLYLQHCADCHGWEGRGDGPLTAVLASKPRPTMPHLARQLSSDEALEIIRYLRTLTPIK